MLFCFLHVGLSSRLLFTPGLILLVSSLSLFLGSTWSFSAYFCRCFQLQCLRILFHDTHPTISSSLSVPHFHLLFHPSFFAAHLRFCFTSQVLFYSTFYCHFVFFRCFSSKPILPLFFFSYYLSFSLLTKTFHHLLPRCSTRTHTFLSIICYLLLKKK